MAERTFKTWRDPYDRGFSTTTKREVTIKEGLTVLVGCNGAGKSTLLRNIKEVLSSDRTPCLFFDNRTEGHSSHTFDRAMMKGDYSYISTALQSSEGENISINLNVKAEEIVDFLSFGETNEDKRRRKWAQAFGHEDGAIDQIDSKERWILFDAVDSGYSIDNVCSLKNFFMLLIEKAQEMGLNLFIVVSANEYELAQGVSCFDVMKGIYVSFDSYEAFKKFILHTAELKDKRAEKEELHIKKKEQQKEDKRKGWKPHGRK